MAQSESRLVETAETSPSDNTKIICPESGIESANERDGVRRSFLKDPKKIYGEPAKAAGKANGFACESGVDSSLRRDFLKKAALATALPQLLESREAL